MLLLAIILMVLSGDPVNSGSVSNLRQVHLLFRHGARTPCDLYPTDPYKDPAYWPVGLGQLTNEGKRMHFELGQWLRMRYDGFLSENYSEQEILVRSTDVDRALMSAQSNLAGLFPPSGYWQWNTHLSWQPIPVHTMPLSMDTRLSTKHTECPRLDEKKEMLKTSPYMKTVFSDNKHLIDYISAHSGWNVQTINQLDFIYDALLVEAQNNLTLPLWAHKVFPGGQFEKLRNLAFLTDTWDEEMQRLQAGPFMIELMSHLDAVTTQSPTRKLFMYSGHDVTISFVLNSLGVFNNLPPPYASLVIFELLYQGDWYVQISYRNNTMVEPYILTIPGCQQLCPLPMFKELTQRLRPGNWAGECHGRQGMKADQSVFLLFILVSAVVICPVFLIIFLTIKNYYSRRSYYQRL